MKTTEDGPRKKKSPSVIEPKGFYAEHLIWSNKDLTSLIRHQSIAVASEDQGKTATATTSGEKRLDENHRVIEVE